MAAMLETSNLPWRTTLKQIAGPAVVVDRQGCFVYVNPAFCRLLGYRPADLRAMLETCGSVGKVGPMLTVVPDSAEGDDRPVSGSSLLDEIVREGVRRMLAEALQAEVDAYVAQHFGERGKHGHRLVVRNGLQRPREVMTSSGGRGASSVGQ